MKKMLKNMGIDDIISKLPLAEKLSNRGYNAKQLIKNFWIGIWSGVYHL